LLGTTFAQLGITGAEGDAAPLGIALRRLVIRRHVLGPVARQGVDELVLMAKSSRP
jgi:hypothetical protein